MNTTGVIFLGKTFTYMYHKPLNVGKIEGWWKKCDGEFEYIRKMLFSLWQGPLEKTPNRSRTYDILVVTRCYVPLSGSMETTHLPLP